MLDLNIFIDDARDNMERAVEHLSELMGRVRAGKANPKILDGISVEYYGNMTPLSQVSTISTTDARTIVITPWEKKLLKDIEKAILNSPVGITPENNGEVIRLGIPPLTEDRRKELVKQVKGDAEDAKISVRNARRDANEAIRKSIKTDAVPEDMAKDAEAKIQTVHDEFIKRIEAVFAEKEKEIMTV